jgi:hypothetical protein
MICCGRFMEEDHAPDCGGTITVMEDVRDDV